MKTFLLKMPSSSHLKAFVVKSYSHVQFCYVVICMMGHFTLLYYYYVEALVRLKKIKYSFSAVYNNHHFWPAPLHTATSNLQSRQF